jgi:hypothetical protein
VETPTIEAPNEQSAPGKQTGSAIIRKEDEAPALRDEILKQIDWQPPLFLAVFFGGSTFLTLGLQPGISGLTVMIYPLAALALALKLSAHDLRTGQINFYLRSVLRSPWEIVRRLLFNGSDITEAERGILAEQGIILSAQLIQEAQKLRPPISDVHALANRLAFLTMEFAAVGIGVIRTYPAALRHDILTIFVWSLSILATLLTTIALGRKRVR